MPGLLERSIEIIRDRDRNAGDGRSRHLKAGSELAPSIQEITPSRRRLKCMRLTRIFVSAYIGVLCYFVLQFFFGAAGLSDYQQLMKHRDILNTNVAQLQTINWQLTQELNLLAADPDKILVLARDLGYFREGDHVIKPEGVAVPKSYYEVGKLIKIPFRRHRDFLAGNIACLVVPILVYLFTGLFVGRSLHGTKVDPS